MLPFTPSPGISLIGSLIMGAIAAYIARRRGKNPYLWFGIGMLLGILGLFLIFFIPNKKRPSQTQDSLAKEPIVTLDITPTVSASSKEKLWYYLSKSNEQFGPMSFDFLKKAFFEGKIKASTYVWNEELDNWKMFENIFDIRTETHST
jgi:hypothetical protein